MIKLKLSPIIVLILLCFGVTKAIPTTEYRKNIAQAIAALDSATLNEEDHRNPEAAQTRRTQVLISVRTLLPLRLEVEWGNAKYLVDHTWLHQQLNEFETAAESDRETILKHVKERLTAVDERLKEIQAAASSPPNDKAEQRQRLEEILARSAYLQKPEEPSALERLWARFLRWLSSLFGPVKPAQPGQTAVAISKGAQVFVVVLALAVIVYVVSMFAPKFRRLRSVKKQSKPHPRIVLGERLEPDQSAVDLLSEAETLARQGEIRAAIRKAYIALLVELGDRKIISLAQHRTNRDYLRALRDRESLYSRMAFLTDSFERHWYGFAHATAEDWVEFRSRYREALQD